MQSSAPKRRKRSRRIYGKCKLCGQQRLLCWSHVVPEFMLRHVRDTDRKFNYIRIRDDGSSHISRLQKNQGPLVDHDRNLLCEECEGLFNKWETPSARILYYDQNLEGRSTKFLHHETDLVERCKTFKVAYKEVKLFCMSLLWRLSASEMEFCKSINLGSHQDKLAAMLLNSDPGGSLDYPCVLMNLTHPKHGFTDFVDLDYRNIGRTVFVQLFAGGFVFNFYVSQLYCPLFIRNFFLRESGDLPMLYRDITSFSAFQELMEWGKKFFQPQQV